MSIVIVFAVLCAGFTASSPVQNDPYPDWNDLPVGPLGALPPTPEMIAAVGYKDVVYDENEEIPEEFDAREKWPHCVSLRTIWDQGTCGSCWAVSSASAMGDRYCIRNKGNVTLSAYDLMSCCSTCHPKGPCDGGYPLDAWMHWYVEGVVTGGPTNCSGCTCYRYGGDTQFKCDHECRIGYEKLYDFDLTHGNPAKYVRNNVEEIQREIMTNGPVVATFEVFTDLGDPGKSVYIHRGGISRGYHAVRVIGWGVKNMWGVRVPYWLVANSWGTEWADGGVFRILRGYDHCRFESMIVAD
ncbi:unnamed protein product [Calicophoron daubneyi]|uniref:Peptidase C1A papain C-terminal domain-containing protein n=1 Tax=Calicophoron daubneyi TaxID=300641 RepID=A0AAV2U0B6_CALDB